MRRIITKSRFPKFTYAAGQVLFDAQKPYKVLARTNEPFIWPNQPYEKVGEVNEVCFVEGLVPLYRKMVPCIMELQTLKSLFLSKNELIRIT